MLSQKYLRAINVNREDILSDLMVKDIISDLRSCESFTRDDEEIILSKVTSTEKTSVLLDILSEKDDSCFENFLDVLGSTYPHLAEGLTTSIENKRIRRLSNTEMGELLIKGGVPDSTDDYIPRKSIEDKILKKIKSETEKPILVHGVIGCGKSSIVAKVLHTDGIFPEWYTRVCWMTIGNIKDKDVLSKLIILSSKLDSKSSETYSEILELYKDRITEKIRRHNVLLILDDIWNSEIMKYFSFPTKYIVTSRYSNLFSDGQFVEVPSQFNEHECNMFLDSYITDKSGDLKKVIMNKSHRNPLTLSMIKNLLKSNKDYFKFINNLNYNDIKIKEIIKINIDILNTEMRKGYEMLSILNEDDTVSLNLLIIFWDINETKALAYVNTFCQNHLMTKIWSEEYKCNAYGLHDFLGEFLRLEYRRNIMEFKQTFINNYRRKFPNWLTFDHCDPYFFRHCARILNSLGDFNTLECLFTDLSFLSSKIVISGISDLLFDYDNYRPNSKSSLWEEFNSFFMRHNHRFVQLPDANTILKIKKVFITIIQLAFCEGSGSKIFNIALEAKNLAMRNDFWIWDNVEPSMKVWENSHIDVITSMDINHCGIILTSEGGRLSLYDFNSGNCLFNYQIFTERCILCKFIKHDTLEFITVSESGRLLHFDILKLLGQHLQVSESIIEDDDFDPSDRLTEQLKINFEALRQRFIHILIKEFLEICQNEFNSLKKNRTYINGSFVNGGLMLTSEAIDNNGTTLIESYDDNGFNLTNDFNIDYKVKKIVHVKIDKDLMVYTLEESGSKLHLHDYLGDELAVFSINNEVIIDFIVCDRDVYQAARNKIYINKEISPLFSTMNDVNIIRISMSHNRTLIALCLTNKSIQIWNLKEKMLRYSLKGFDFSDIQFESCGNYLITTERSNVSKWSMYSINQTNNRNYRSQFYMHNSASSVTWIVQKYTNELEVHISALHEEGMRVCNNVNSEIEQILLSLLRTYSLGDYSGRFIPSGSKATCISTEENYAFIGFRTSNIQIYNLLDLTCELIIESVNNVSNLAVFGCDDTSWKLVAHYDVNKIKIFSILKSDRSYKELENKFLGEINKLKIFKINSDYLIIGLCRNNECVLYGLKKDYGLEMIVQKDVRKNYNIIDFDVNDLGSILCAATSEGTLEIWSVQENLELSDSTETTSVIRICKFRPHTESKWNLVATASDAGEVRLIYFKDDEMRVNIIIEDFTQNIIGMFATMKWTVDGMFIILGDNEIKKWKVPLDPMSKSEVKYPLTKLYTYSGGIRCINMNNDFISTIDQMGFFYIFRKV